MKKVIVTLACLSVSGLALAQDTAATEPAPAPVVATSTPMTDMGAPAEPMAIPEGRFGAMSSINGSFASDDAPAGSIMGFYTMKNMLVGIGLGFGFNDRLPAKKAQLDLGVNFEYFLYNKNGVAIGPQITVTTALANQGGGEAFDNLLIAPGLAFWYTPWQAPIAIGASWDLGFNLSKNQGDERKVVVATQTPALRFAWMFP